MKLLITENRLFDTIYKYIDGTIDFNNISWVNSMDDDKDEDSFDYQENKNFLIFFKGEWEGESYSDIVFYYFTKDYYDGESSSKPFKDSAPVLDVLEEYGQQLSTMFGKHWREPMKKWFEDNFNLPVKTVNTWY